MAQVRKGRGAAPNLRLILYTALQNKKSNCPKPRVLLRIRFFISVFFLENVNYVLYADFVLGQRLVRGAVKPPPHAPTLIQIWAMILWPEPTGYKTSPFWNYNGMTDTFVSWLMLMLLVMT